MLYKINGQFVSREKLLQLKGKEADPATQSRKRKSDEESEIRNTQKSLVRELLIEILNEDEFLQVQREDGVEESLTEDKGVREDSAEQKVPVLLHEEQPTQEGMSDAATELQSE